MTEVAEMKPHMNIAVIMLAGSWLSGTACFSRLNREGPDVTCSDLQNGAVNACSEGIIASCGNGSRVTYEVCDDMDACEAIWQTKGAYSCRQGADGGTGGHQTGGAGGSAAGAGGSSGTAACGIAWPSHACAACVQQLCCAPTLACAASPKCAACSIPRSALRS
jgi:hypothetical protein